MLDFVTEGHVPRIIWVLYFIVVIVVFAKGVAYINKQRNFHIGQRTNVRNFIVLFTIFALFYCLNSDFFRYREFVYDYNINQFKNADSVDIGDYVALISNGSNELFRIIIWGGTFVLFNVICKILKVPAYLSLLLFFMMFNDVACYARVTLAMSVFFLGLSLTLEKKKYVIGLILMLSSVYFHRSLVVALPSLIILFTPKKKIVQFLLYAGIFVSLIYIINFLMGSTDAMMDDDSLSYFGRKMSRSEDKIVDGSYSKYGGILGIVNDIFSYIIFYVPILGVFVKKNKELYKYGVSKSIMQIYKVTLFIMLVATGFLVVYQSFNVLFYRILYLCIIPIPIIIAELLSKNVISKKFVFITIALAFVHQLGLFISNLL